MKCSIQILSIFVVLFLAPSCLLFKGNQQGNGIEKPMYGFVYGLFGKNCFSRAETEKIRGSDDSLNIDIERVIVPGIYGCVGLYRVTLSKKPCISTDHGMKCYFLKFDNKIELIFQNPNKVAVMTEFLKLYGTRLTPIQRKQIMRADSLECEMVGGF
jgi:hypothetical protein